MATSMYPACASFKDELLAGSLKTGMFIQGGSALTVEMAARSGLDYVLLDQEHGLGGPETLLTQLMAVAGTPCFPIVRLPWLEAPQFKKVLDAGAWGVMVPYVETEQQARDAVAAMRYPPHGGVRGVAKTTRATNFGRAFDEYWDHALRRLVLVAQVRRAYGPEWHRTNCDPPPRPPSRSRRRRASTPARPSRASTASTFCTWGRQICPCPSVAESRSLSTSRGSWPPAVASPQRARPRARRRESCASRPSTSRSCAQRAIPS